MVKFTEQIPEHVFEHYCRVAKISKKEAYLILKGVGEEHGKYGMYHAVASLVDKDYDSVNHDKKKSLQKYREEI